MGTIRQVIIYNSHLVVMVLEKGIVDHISASRVGLLLFWWKRKMKMNSSKLHLLNIKRKETKSERYMVRDTQTWSKSITLKILSLSLGTLSTPERWPDFSSFFKHCSWKAQQTIVVPKNWGAYFSAWTKIWSDKCFEIMLTYFYSVGGVSLLQAPFSHFSSWENHFPVVKSGFWGLISQ